jgi:hypothetical protein
MAVLGNSRYELFAQELAKGKRAAEAYATAGFKLDPGNANHLRERKSKTKSC